MKNIDVSVTVFARIWSLRQDGENTENEILDRVLIPVEKYSHKTTKKTDHKEGLYDIRNDVFFPNGFKIDRVYKGIQYIAKIHRNKWKIEGLDGNFIKLNDLSRAIGTKTENVWVNWFYTNDLGKRVPVTNLRNPEKIITRKNKITTVESTDLEHYNATKGNNSMEKIRWVDDVKSALINLGGKAHLSKIYQEVEKIRSIAGRSIPNSLEPTIRRTLEDHSSDSLNFRAEDWFIMTEGKGKGIWSLRNYN